MSFEQPPKIPNPESADKKKSTIPIPLNSKNQNFWGGMSEGGRKIASQVYEGLYKIPGVNRVVGKMEIAYNQFSIDKHEKKSVELKNKMDGLGLKIEAFEQSKKEIESFIENLKQQSIPGVASLESKVKDIDRQKNNLLDEKNRVESKFKEREDKIKLYTNERDRVADKLIGRYEEKLKPMEKELENLQTCKDHAELVIAVTEVKHKEQIADLDGTEKSKTEVEEAFRRTGMSEKEIRKSVKETERYLSQSREKIWTEKENLNRREAEINAKIAKVDAKANPYRDKREEFVRVKEGRPLKIDVPTRERGQEFKGTEETTSHTRAENSGYESSRTYERESSVEAEEETVEEDKERLETSNYISDWNSYLQKKYKKILPGELIDQKDFLGLTGLSAEHKLDFKDFKNILTKYYKFRKIPADKLNKSIDNFFTEKIKVENS